MAKNTDLSLRGQMIYCVYVRNHSKEGSFAAVERDLKRIRALGTDIIYLMPIHPIGVEGRKGSLGCPYANRDYRTVNPEYGTMEDFIHLVDAIHAEGMKCIIDVVYNHTSPDSTLRHAHPEFFYHSADGGFGNRFGDWADVIDLDYGKRALWDYQIETLKMWAKYVDGFRCDVASLVPVAFWAEARRACEDVKPGMIWLAESVHKSFQLAARRAGMEMIYSDGEGYEAFDMEYDYDIRELLDDYWAGKRPLHEWVDALNEQECAYPKNYIKMRCLENHDQPRIAGRVADPIALSNWHALLFMLKGTTLIYAGEEFCDANQPSLFERDEVNWSGRDISPEICRLARIKKEYLPADGWFHAVADDEQDAVIVEVGNGEREFVGVFSLKGKPVKLNAKSEGTGYINLIDGQVCMKQNAQGDMLTDGRPQLWEMPCPGHRAALGEAGFALRWEH